MMVEGYRPGYERFRPGSVSGGVDLVIREDVVWTNCGGGCPSFGDGDHASFSCRVRTRSGQGAEKNGRGCGRGTWFDGKLAKLAVKF